MLPKNRPPSQSSMCDFLFIAVLNGTDTANSLGVFCSKSHLSNQRVLLTPHPLLSILYPLKKEVTWVFSAPSHLQVIREAININALPKKRKIGCSLLQVTSKLFERKPTSIPSQKRGNLGVLCRKSHSSNSRDKKRHLPPKKRRSSMATPPMLTGMVRTSSGVNRLGA